MTSAPIVPRVTIDVPRRPPVRFDFGFGFGAAGSDGEDGFVPFPEFPPSVSVDLLSGLDGGLRPDFDQLASFWDEKPSSGNSAIPRSQSVDLGFRFD
jgi:hypothetical protein